MLSACVGARGDERNRQTILLVINDALCAEPNLFLVPLNVCVCVCVCVCV